MARKRTIPDADIELNMTPMIDVVFNLIIFFMVITDMSQSELEYLVLPKAELAIEDKGEDQERLILNIIDLNNPNNADKDKSLPPILLKGRQFKKLADLRRQLRHYADPTLYPERENPTTHKKMDPVGRLKGKAIYPSRKSLLIRCDQAQMFGWVQAVMQLCTIMPGHKMPQELRESPFIYKIEIAVAEDKPVK